MPAREVHRCQCPACQAADPHPDRELHAQMNLLLSRVDEQQRRWYAALESHKLGHGGDTLVALATGLDVPLSPAEDLDRTRVVSMCGRRPVRLTDRLAGGGEGTVHATDRTGLVCKLYHRDRLTVGSQRKVELMVTRRVPDPMICWPTEAVFDAASVFRGFLMPRALGEPLGHGLFLPTAWTQRHPGWTRRESVGLP